MSSSPECRAHVFTLIAPDGSTQQVTAASAEAAEMFGAKIFRCAAADVISRYRYGIIGVEPVVQWQPSERTAAWAHVSRWRAQRPRMDAMSRKLLAARRATA